MLPFWSEPLKTVEMLLPPTVRTRAAVAEGPTSTMPAPASEPIVAATLFKRSVPPASTVYAEA
ncbi:MAG: hypothetical protein QM775_17995 [Pirellulales bacterium]